VQKEPEYYIQDGVRRAVAAREAGWSDIPARLIEQGKADLFFRVALSQLYSPKDFILRDYRYIRNVEYPTLVLRTQPPAIEIEQLGTPGQSAVVPLAQVILA
jgi:hypothetical protein